MFLVVIYYLIFAITLLYGLYFIIVSILGILAFNKKRLVTKTKQENYFAILIPARNEESVIAALIDSLKKQNYNSQKYKIYVITNNCFDNTGKVAISHGATVLECHEKVKTKGEVLKWALTELDSHKEIDAYIIARKKSIESIVRKEIRPGREGKTTKE